MEKPKERELDSDDFPIKHCVLCGSSRLHKVEGKKGLYECVDCGGKFRVRDGNVISIISWGDEHG